MNDTVEFTRTFSVEGDEMELRAPTDGDGRTIYGQAVPYGRDQRIDANLTERFARGAFTHQLPAMHRVPATYQHQSMGGAIIGRISSAEETDRGLQVAMRVSDTAVGRDTLTLVRDGAVGQLSIGFRVKQGHSRQVNGVTERTRASLFEVAIVPEGAYSDHAAIAGVRAADEVDEEEVVPGMTLDQARALAARIPLLPVGMIV